MILERAFCRCSRSAFQYTGDFGQGGILLHRPCPYHCLLYTSRVKTLATNRRSETNIIRFNNHIFTAATDYLHGVYKKQLNKDCRDLQKAYADVVQESPLNTQKRCV